MTGAPHEGRHGEHIATHLQAAARGFGGNPPAAAAEQQADQGDAGETEMEDEGE